MRTGSTYLQDFFRYQNDICFILKSRFFSYDPLFFKGQDYYFNTVIGKPSELIQCVIDSDENYSMGRFKKRLLSKTDHNFNFKAELNLISHDVPAIVRRMKSIVPDAKIIGVIRKQVDWLLSVYKHDVFHFAMDLSFTEFIKSDLGKAYVKAADFLTVFNSFEKSFGKDNIHILLFEDLKTEPKRFFRELTNFLPLNIEFRTKKTLRKNTSHSDWLIILIRHINKLSQKNPDRPEIQTYLLCRYLLPAVLGRVKLKIPIKKPLIISEKDKIYLQDRYRYGNRTLSNKLDKEDDMKKYGYF